LAGSTGISSSSKLYSLGSLAAAAVLAGAPEAAGPPFPTGAVAAGAVVWEAPVVAGAEGAREVG